MDLDPLQKNKEEDSVVLIDTQDQIIGTASKQEAHKKALLHRAVSVFVFNSNGEWLIQRRALHKYHSGGLWSNTCCTHPYLNETYAQAAARRLAQEMGLETPLTYLFDFIYKAELDSEMIEHELDHVFIGISDEEPQIALNEVCDYRYLSYEDLKEEMERKPEEYTYWFKRVFELVHEKLDEFGILHDADTLSEELEVEDEE